MRRLLCAVVGIVVSTGASVIADEPAARPNILWISTEDISPDLGCYGDEYAISPTIDQLAREGVLFTSAFSHSGVCAPTRSGIITGVHPTTMGTNQMRCRGVPGPDVRCFPEYLRAAGYYCTNNSKTDYQFEPPPSAWDENGNRADWSGRAEGQPFFAVINFTTTHESQIRAPSKKTQQLVADLPAKQRHDPDEAVVPPYYPDTETSRTDWANYADTITAMDGQVAAVLQRLHDEGLAEDTIVWFWGDHGRGLPRAKRWIYDSGLQVPLIIRVPEKWRTAAAPQNPESVAPGTVNENLVAFVDFAPTVLSLAGVPIPEHIQGQAFLGPAKAEPREYIYAARDRMDEAYDCIRAVRDHRFKYIRNFMSHLGRGQDIAYMNRMPTLREMRELNAEGQLEWPKTQYFEQPKPVEELYDTEADPHEIHNLADEPEYAETLQRLRAELLRWMRETHDTGLIPEPLFDAVKHPTFNEPGLTGTPGIEVRPIDDDPQSMEVLLECTTPGSSIIWQVGDSPWKLYVDPIRLSPGTLLKAKACRIGFKVSETLSLKIGNEPLKTISRPSPHDEIPHWSTTIRAAHPPGRLEEIKALDGRTLTADAVLPFLGDESAAVRYWGVIATHHQTSDDVLGELTEQLRQLRDADPTWTVRIAAAETLADRIPNEVDASLATLVEGLDAKLATERLHAMIALNHLGSTAAPVRERIVDAIPDGTEYIKNVAQDALSTLNSAR